MIDIKGLRIEYKSHSLDAETMESDPFDQFLIWFKEALGAQVAEVNAMTLATATAEGRASSRTVLLKGFDRSGCVFYTNYESRKAQEMEANPQVSLTFLWHELIRQVGVEGVAEKVTREESEAYFASRPRGSQLSAWVSRQDAILPSQTLLKEEYARLEKFYKGKVIPLPHYWGGYRIKPSVFEFWQGRPNRLHDRVRYRLVEGGWKRERLSP